MRTVLLPLLPLLLTATGWSADEKAPQSSSFPRVIRPNITEPVPQKPGAGACQANSLKRTPAALQLLAQMEERPKDFYGLPGHPADKRAGQRVSANGPAKLERAATLGTQRITGVEPTACDPAPTARTQFTTTDPTVWHFLTVSGAAAGEVVVWEWLRPDGTRHDTTRLTLNVSGSVCMWAGLNIAGTSTAGFPGTWTVRVTVNNTPLATTTFTLGGGNTPGGGGAGTRVCRNELSLFYQGAHSLGTAWVRPVFEGSFLSPLAISQIQGALDNLLAGVNAIPCIVFDRTRITALSRRIPTLSPDTAITETEALIRDLQLAVRTVPLTCDSGVNLESLFVVGVHLGAAVGWSTGFTCQDAIPADVISAMQAHLDTARQAAEAYRPCSSSFDPDLFRTAINLNEPGIEVFTDLVGVYNLYVWNVSLSDCCCTCGGPGGSTGGGAGAVGIVSGTVRNASNGQVLANARVTVVGATSVNATTAADGTYTLRSVPAGAQRLEASATGFITTTVNVNVTSGQTLTQNISLSPVLQTGQIRITLNWTKTNNQPNDLDMHLVGPVPNSTSCFHIYYSSAGSLTASPFAQLEVDNINVSGDPPTETVRIERLTPGIYRFYVHNYSGNSQAELAASRATVQVFGSGGQTFSDTVPSGTGVYWSVFTMDGTTGQITRTGTISGTAPPQTCR